MVIVPDFLIKRIYQKGSLKAENGYVCLKLKNVLGPGFISGFNYVKINGVLFEPKDVKFLTNGQEILATDLSDENPISFRLGQEGTLIMQGQNCIVEGKNKIEIEALNPEAGKVLLSVEDTI